MLKITTMDLSGVDWRGDTDGSATERAELWRLGAEARAGCCQLGRGTVLGLVEEADMSGGG
jgi:hypothetical protein